MIFTYSLFIDLCSASSNMTGYSHSYHSIKLIHCSAPQRDVLSDKMVFWVVTHSFYFMLCQSYLLSTVTSFVYKEKWWWLIFFISCFASLLYKKKIDENFFECFTDEDFFENFHQYCHKLCGQRQIVVRWKHVSYLLYGKYLKNNSFIHSPHIELNLKTLLCNWRDSP